MTEKVSVYGSPVDEGALEQIVRCSKHEAVVGAAMMADHHLGYAVPIGGVVAYRDAVSPSGVGYDIACGNKAVRLDADAATVRSDIGKIMDEVVERVSFGIGTKNNVCVDHELFDDDAWSIRAVSTLKAMARNQLGTVGAGNHYVDVFVDHDDHVWVGVHFGSRGFGHKTATWFLKEGGAVDAIHSDPLVLPAGSALGAEYIECMRLAGRYAYAGRDWVCAEVARIIGANIIEEVHNHHNFAWCERHGGEWLWVVRKGATPAFPGQRGFIGGSMGEDAVLVEGVESEEGPDTFYSTVHGAGRAMSRTAARGRFVKDESGKKQRQPGLVRHDEWMAWMDRAGVELRGGDLDEAPQAYKRLPEVLSHHAGTIRVTHTLKPIGVAMAGANVVDPYKD